MLCHSAMSFFQKLHVKKKKKSCTSCPFLPLLQYHHLYPIISFILDALWVFIHMHVLYTVPVTVKIILLGCFLYGYLPLDFYFSGIPLWDIWAMRIRVSILKGGSFKMRSELYYFICASFEAIFHSLPWRRKHAFWFEYWINKDEVKRFHGDFLSF